ncbi:kinase-like domain-containing protein [Xylariomycetidae sp. FL2044]|nr:kinase-like domain-containing protein [Xylariomycetidae sp. FL2044]
MGDEVQEIDQLSRANPEDYGGDVATAWEKIQQLKREFGTGRRFKYGRCLGYGGNGLAATFTENDSESNAKRSIVLKMSFQENKEDQIRDLKDERLMHHILRRASHIVQLLFVSNEDFMPDGADNHGEPAPIDRAASGLGQPNINDDAAQGGNGRLNDSPLNVLITEFLPNGDLTTLIGKCYDHSLDVPNTILWRFFLCLTRMCIAMAYPPASLPEYDDTSGLVAETVPRRDDLENNPRRIVHFDFDPSNIFVGELDPDRDTEHGISPILKLGDFGLAKDILSGQSNQYYAEQKWRAKRGYFAPEQFCSDWDYIPESPDTVKDHPIAGNYAAHTNIWAIGLVMETLITQCHPALPPTPRTISTSPPPGKTEYVTYGDHLTRKKYARVDPELIRAVLRCQAHWPEDRPKLHELEELIGDNIKTKSYPDETPESIRAWLRIVLHEPPPEEAATARSSDSAAAAGSSAEDPPGWIVGGGT